MSMKAKDNHSNLEVPDCIPLFGEFVEQVRSIRDASHAAAFVDGGFRRAFNGLRIEDCDSDFQRVGWWAIDPSIRAMKTAEWEKWRKCDQERERKAFEHALRVCV